MKLKPLLIMVLLLAIGAGAAYWLSPGTRQANDAATEDVFLAPETLDRAHRIEITGSNEDRVTLEKTVDGRWILPDHHGMPADFDKLGRFTRSLLDAGIERQVTANPERLARLDIGRYQVVLRDVTGNATWEVEFGGSGPSGGTFFRPAGAEAAYLTADGIHPDTRADNWIVKRPLDFSSQEVAGLSLTFDGHETPLILEREGPDGPFHVTDENENVRRAVNTSELNRLLTTLLNARFDEVRDTSDPDAEQAREHAREITLRHVDGETYTIRIGRRPARSARETEREEPAETAPARVEASIIFDQDGNIVELPESDEGPSNEEGSETIEDEPGPVFIVYHSDDEHFPWTRISNEVALQFPERVYNALPESADDLLEPLEPAEVDPE